jgi:hypothetical protein
MTVKPAKINDYAVPATAIIFAGNLFRMKKLFLLLLALAVSVFVVWKFVLKKEKKADEPQPAAMLVSQHSESFNQSMTQMMNAYFEMTEAFVNWDTLAINQKSALLKSAIDSLKLAEMKKDTAIYPTVENQWGNLKAEINGLVADATIGDKRESLNSLSQYIFDLLRIVKYDASKVYYQECPMALNNYNASAFWLSTSGKTEDRRNPYLGLHDPEYGKGMLKCGSTRDSLNFNSSNQTGQ